MKKLTAICALLAFCAGPLTALADKDKDKDKDKHNHPHKENGVPPGLAKKGGLPPGIAKKQEERSSTAVTTPAPAATPAPAVTPAAPAPTAPASTPPPATTASSKPAQPAGTTTTTTRQPVTFEEQKAKLDAYTKTINENTQRPRLKAVALRQIANETGVPFEKLEQQDKTHPEVGTTAFLMAHLIAKRSGAKFENLIQARLKGKHWADIAKYHNVEVGPLIAKAKDVASVVQASAAASSR